MATSPREVRSPSNPFLEMAESWNRFWFRPSDPTVLGLMRLCCGFLVLYVHFAYTYDLQTFFGREAWVSQATIEKFRHHDPIAPVPSSWDESDLPKVQDATPEERAYIAEWGVDPRLLSGKGHHYWSIWYHVTDPFWMAVVHTCILVIMFFFAIGLCTRVTSVLTWVAMLSYLQRAPTSLFGMDTMMNIGVLYLMIGPSGAALSADRLIRHYCAKRRALQENRPRPDFPPPRALVSANLALRLVQVNLCFIYLASGLSKLLGPAWWNGTAPWGTMANYEFSPMQIPLYMETLKYISASLPLWQLVMTGGTLFTLFFEIGFTFLVWNRRLRWLMLICAVQLHLMIALFMGLVTFSLMMLTLVLAFVPADAVKQLLSRLHSSLAVLHSGQGTGKVEGHLVKAGTH